MGENEVWTLIQGYSPTKIRRFNGSDYARNAAENRAYALLGTTYDLITSNCEHFANYVQFGKYKSQQSDNFAAIGVFGGLALILIALTGSR